MQTYIHEGARARFSLHIIILNRQINKKSLHLNLKKWSSSVDFMKISVIFNSDNQNDHIRDLSLIKNHQLKKGKGYFHGSLKLNNF
ncbi:hypothetical protein BpHYR1_049056 [Brachionus plicatilis]|uniref:Uncharacterized protein n=1 Tax=Brachionus plicatilis TaxID=10195 RepID=A0A3M7SE11_BRAPC|nr:hypothetical protein BpHYR1_049056 [Brachionus plicatilis]